MSEDSVPYGNPQKDIYSIEFNGNCNEQRLFDTAQKILLANITDEKYIKTVQVIAEQSAKLSQEQLEESFGYHVEKEEIANEIIVHNAISLAETFMRRYQQRLP